MEIDRSQIVDLLHVRGQPDKAAQAERELPTVVDTQRDAELLAEVDLDEESIVGGLEGTAGLGNDTDL